MAGLVRAGVIRPSGGWPVVALSAAVAGVGAGPGFLYGFLGPALQRDLALGRGDLGLLIGVFFGCTGVAALVAARWGPRLGARDCLGLNMAAVAASMAAVAAAPSYVVLLGAAATSGLAYAFGNVGTTMAVVLAAPAGRTGFGLSVKTAGVPVVAAVLALGTGAPVPGWTWLAWTLAAAALVVGVLVVLVLPSARTTPSGGPDGARLPRGFWLLPLAAFLFIGGSQPLQSWTVTYVHDAGGVSTSLAGPVVAAGTLLGTVLMLVVARWADAVGARRRALLVAGISLAAAFGVLVTVAATPWWLPLGMAGAVLGIAANLAGAGLSHAVAAERSPDAVGRGSGMLLSGYYVGALVAPWAFGVLADATGGYTVPWLVCAVLLVLAAVVFQVVHVVLPVGERVGTVTGAAAVARRSPRASAAGRRRG